MTEFDATAALAPLKPFQRATVDHAIRRLLTDEDSVRQFLVADEVGLGKTMVARGVIARLIEKLQGSGQRDVAIIYLCSNAAISFQNMRKLNVIGPDNAVRPTRLSLLAHELTKSKDANPDWVRLFSLSPDTSLRITRGTGKQEERALLLRLLAPMLRNLDAVAGLLKGRVEEKNWRNTIVAVQDWRLDQGICETFYRWVAACPDLVDALQNCAVAFEEAPSKTLITTRGKLLARLRGMLALAGMQALRADLVILDEFQRFSTVFFDGDCGSEDDLPRQLARALVRSDIGGAATRTLLLSATPYKMLSLASDEESGEQHDKEFMKVVSFLYGPERGPRVRATLEAEMRRFRRALQRLPEAGDEALACKTGIEADLRGVIARTERVSETKAADAMVRDVPVTTDIQTGDLREARAVARIAKAVGASYPVDYWKSAPWLLSFMRDYDLSRRIAAQAEAPSPALVEAMAEADLCQIDTASIEAYTPIVPSNGRMRSMMDIAFDNGLGTRLWMPPTLPYAGPPHVASKTLVFSQWAMVPDAIAGVLSFEAERRMGMGREHGYSDPPKTRPLMFRRGAQERLAGLRALQLVVPSPTLAALADPLRLVRTAGPFEGPRDLAAAAEAAVKEAAHGLADASEPAREETWDWAAAAALDVDRTEGFAAWLHRDADLRSGVREDGAEAWHDHLDALAETGSAPLRGTPDAAALRAHLALVALGSPATCALRALSRVVALPLDHPAMLRVGFETNSTRSGPCEIAGDASDVGDEHPCFGAGD